VLAAKHPFHRDLLGYKGLAAPKDHPEYLWARRGKRLYLNLIDSPEPKYVNPAMIDFTLRFIAERLAALTPESPEQVLIHCNQGRSRAPTIAMLHLAPQLPENFEEAEAAFREIYPDYEPSEGMRGFARIHWRRIRNRNATPSEDKIDWALAKATELWQQFGHSQAAMVEAVSTALQDAANGKIPTQEPDGQRTASSNPSQADTPPAAAREP
jgi:hypothetical protein